MRVHVSRLNAKLEIHMLLRLDHAYFIKPRQLCWAGIYCHAHERLCVSVCVSVNKISQKLFKQ